MHVLVTRPKANAAATIEALERLGHTACHAPLLEIYPIDQQLPSGTFDLIVVTSVHGAQTLASKWCESLEIEIVVTGNATAKILLDAGFKNVMSVEGGAMDVVHHIIAMSDRPKRILYPRAERVAHDLARHFEPHGIQCIDWIIYRSLEAGMLSGDIKESLINGSIDAVLLYSARTAEVFVRLAPDDMSGTVGMYALSCEIAASLGETLGAKCLFPQKPVQSELLALLS